jgi:hypothetical protein
MVTVRITSTALSKEEVAMKLQWRGHSKLHTHTEICYDDTYEYEIEMWDDSPSRGARLRIWSKGNFPNGPTVNYSWHRDFDVAKEYVDSMQWMRIDDEGRAVWRQ